MQATFPEPGLWMQNPTFSTASLIVFERIPGWRVAFWADVSSSSFLSRERSMIHPPGPIVDHGLLPPDLGTNGILFEMATST